MTTVSRCKPCAPRSGEAQGAAPPRAFLSGLEGNLEVCGGRGTKQDKGRRQISRSAGHNYPQCGQFQGP